LSAFVERSYAETNSFHLPIEDMTITLDDVSSLLYLPIVGQFFTYPTLDTVGATNLLVETLKVSHDTASTETE